MKVPLSWLKEYVSLDGIAPQELAERLTLAGLEVASIDYIGVEGPPRSTHLVWDPATIRVGELLAVAPHPDADRLRLATVAYGAEAPKTVVTGAPNLAVGMKVAYATTGATVINGYSDAHEFVTLKPKKLRGVLSEGMVLSELELGLGDSHEGILELPEDAPVGEALQAYLGDVVLDIELTPNIVGHAASIVGVAREVAALFERELHYPTLTWEGSGPPAADAVEIIIDDPALNPRFTAALIRHVEIGPSPAWMQRRLLLCDQRPINNIVDVTNYVMLEMGQPLHAFDYDRLVARAQQSDAARPTIRTRAATAGEAVTTLDDKRRTLRAGDIVVTDSAGIVAMAGVMGGAETEVSEATTNVLLEGAAWNYIAIRRTAAHHMLHSGASYRFSRNVHPAMALRGTLRGAMLMAQVGGGELAAGIVDHYPQPRQEPTLPLRAARVNQLLGTELRNDEVAAILRRLEFEVEIEGEQLHVTVPDYRTDIEIEADLVEEVARVYGLDTLPETLMDDLLPPLRNNEALPREERLRDLLVAAGVSEIISYRLTAPEREARLQGDEASRDVSDEGYVQIANPISPERRVMRQSILASVLESLAANLRHRDRAALFEIGHIYQPTTNALLPREQGRLALAMSGAAQPVGWQRGEPRERDYFDMKGVIESVVDHLHIEGVTFEAAEHPTYQTGRAAAMLLNGQPIGMVGEVAASVRDAYALPEPRVVAAEIDVDALLSAVPRGYLLRDVPRFPAVYQDLAVVVPEATTQAEVLATIRASGPEQLVDVQLFDLYRGQSIPEGRKSLAYALHYQSTEATLTDEQVAGYHATISDALRHQLGAKIRGEDL